MTRFLDVSLPIGPDTPVWPGDPPIHLARSSRLEDGAPANVSELRLGSHSGTHVDAPVHFLPDGAGVDEWPLDRLTGPALVARIDGPPQRIPAGILEGLEVPDGVERLLLDTGNRWSRSGATGADLAEQGRAVGLDEDAARWIVDRGIRLVGIDRLSIERSRDGVHFPVHTALLEAEVVILESLDLSDVEPGDYTLLCLPLRIAGCDGAPARVALRRD
jgi:arylformamidase